MSVSPERPAESLSLGLQAVHGAKRRPLAPRGQRHGKGETEKCRRHAKLVSADWRESGGVIQELLRLRLHIQHGHPDAACRAQRAVMPCTNRRCFQAAVLPPPAPSRSPWLSRPWRSRWRRRKLGAILVAASHDPLAGGLDTIGRRAWLRSWQSSGAPGAASCAKREAAYLEWRMMISSKSSTPHRLRFWHTARR